MKIRIPDFATGQELQLLAMALEGSECRAEARDIRAALSVIRRVDLECESCGDRCRANCADTVGTFGAMHWNCRIRLFDIGAGQK